MNKERKKFVIRIVYKSGYTHDFPVYEFSIDGGRYTWNAADESNYPVKIGAEDISAVYCVG